MIPFLGYIAMRLCRTYRSGVTRLSADFLSCSRAGIYPAKAVISRFGRQSYWVGLKDLVSYGINLR